MKLYEKPSGLEFSKETGRVKCSEHGWVEFKIDEDEDSYATLETMYCSIPYIRLWRGREVAGLRTQLERLRQELDELKQLRINPARVEENRVFPKTLSVKTLLRDNLLKPVFPLVSGKNSSHNVTMDDLS